MRRERETTQEQESTRKDELSKGVDRKRPPSFKGCTPKQKWWMLFRNRHPQLTFRTPESLSSQWKNLSVANIKQ